MAHFAATLLVRHARTSRGGDLGELCAKALELVPLERSFVTLFLRCLPAAHAFRLSVGMPFGDLAPS